MELIPLCHLFPYQALSVKQKCGHQSLWIQQPELAMFAFYFSNIFVLLSGSLLDLQMWWYRQANHQEVQEGSCGYSWGFWQAEDSVISQMIMPVVAFPI